MVRKAVIPAAGFGTRFLPATKTQPKEMLPIVDKPVIQYVIEELAAAGIRDVVMVIGKGKRSIEEHFDRSWELETQLEQKGRHELLEQMRGISSLVDLHFVWQQEMLGLGHAVWCARHHVGDEPFMVLLGDTIIDADVPAAKQLLDVYADHPHSMVLLEEVPRELVSRYGVADGEEVSPGVLTLNGLVEKPPVETAPSNLAIASRYILTPGIFDCLERIEPGVGGELQLTDAMRMLMGSEPMMGVRLKGRRCDIGNKVGFVEANLDFALKDPEMAGDLKAYLKRLVADM
jgi:UTP--glucose-1-phosphate uridylyltransferase